MLCEIVNGNVVVVKIAMELKKGNFPQVKMLLKHINICAVYRMLLSCTGVYAQAYIPEVIIR